MSKKSLVLIAALLITACIPAFGFDPSVPADQRSAILFSWDGVQREHLMECLSRNELPNLAVLIEEGNIVNIDITGHQTATKPGHVQMLTGYDPDVTGAKTNPEFKIIPEGYSIFERLETAFGRDNIATIMITGAIHHIGACPPSKTEELTHAMARLADPGAKLDPAERERLNFTVQNKYGEPFYHVSRSIDFWDGEVRRDCSVNGPIVLDALDKYGKGRFFAFVHFRNPDHEGHAHGENSKQYNDAIIECDKWLGEITKKLKSLGTYDKTMVFATSDHGFDEGMKGHSNAPRVYLVGNMKSLKQHGNQRDIVPTILTEMGVDISSLYPKYKGAVLTAQDHNRECAK